MPERIDVLLVDEDEEVLGLARTFLEKKSDRIAAAIETDPTQAVERTIDEGFDCVVSDYRMPEMNGGELCVQLREHDDRPFFLFTAASSGEVMDSTLESRVNGFVQKGAGTGHYDELVELIEREFE